MSEMIELCKKIAYEAHKGQTRRDGKTPYIEHVKKVVDLVGDNEQAQCIAWLHDVIEDTSYTFESLSDLGVEHSIAYLVDELLTHREGVPYSKYIKEIREFETVREVKLADIVANLSDSPTDRQATKYHEALRILCER